MEGASMNDDERLRELFANRARCPKCKEELTWNNDLRDWVCTCDAEAKRLEPLGDPAGHAYSKRHFLGCCSGSWETWNIPSHLERLYQRCDELLTVNEELRRRVEELERLLGVRA